jgi:hypothetical protein
MKTFGNLFLAGCCLVCASMFMLAPASGQLIDLTGDTAVVAPVDAASVPDADDGQTNHDRTLAEIRKAIDDDEDIRPFRKRMLHRKLNRPKVALAVTDYVTAAAIDNGVIDMPAPPMWATNPDAPQQTFEVARLDLTGLLAFIEAILPLILQLIGLFGGFMFCMAPTHVYRSAVKWIEENTWGMSA